MNQTWEMAKNLVSALTSKSLAQIWAHKFFSWMLPLQMIDIVASVSQTWENGGEKTSFGSDFGPFGQMQAAKGFFKNLALSVTRYPDQVSSCTISEWTNDPLLRKLSDEWTDKWLDTDQREWF